MPEVSNREQFKDYCLRKLGFPVIEINVDDDQVEDRVDEALYYYQQFHFDATENYYHQHQITSTDIANKYITIPDNIIGVTRIFSFTNANLTRNMFDIRYQMRLQDIQSLLSASFSQYYVTQTHLSMIDLLIVGETPIDFNRHRGRLHIHIDWDTLLANDWLIIESTRVIDPDDFPKVWGDIWLKRYATALIKKQWGENMKKFGQITLPGGVMLNGQQIYDEGSQEVKDLEEQIRSEFELPPAMIVA